MKPDIELVRTIRTGLLIYTYNLKLTLPSPANITCTPALRRLVMWSDFLSILFVGRHGLRKAIEHQFRVIKYTFTAESVRTA